MSKRAITVNSSGMDRGKSYCAQLRADYLVVIGMLLWATKQAVKGK